MPLLFKRINIGACLICFAVASVRPGARAFAQAPAAKPCSQPVYRQFDFWAGDWDAFELGTGTKDAHVRVERILGGCVLHEQYDGLDGHRGESFSIYDSSRKVWQQTWVTNRGELLVIEGNLEALSRQMRTAETRSAETQIGAAMRTGTAGLPRFSRSRPE